MAVKAEIKGNKLIITADIPENPAPSSTGKTLMLASLNEKGVVALNGSPVTIGFNAYIKNPSYVKPGRG